MLHGAIFTTIYLYSTPTILTIFCLLHICLWHLCLLSRTNTLTLNDMVERVSNYTGLDECSVCTGWFYRENNKTGPKSRSVFGFDSLRFIQFFLTKNNKEKNRDHGNRSVLAGVRFYQCTVLTGLTVYGQRHCWCQ